MWTLSRVRRGLAPDLDPYTDTDPDLDLDPDPDPGCKSSDCQHEQLTGLVYYLLLCLSLIF